MWSMSDNISLCVCIKFSKIRKILKRLGIHIRVYIEWMVY